MCQGTFLGSEGWAINKTKIMFAWTFLLCVWICVLAEETKQTKTKNAGSGVYKKISAVDKNKAGKGGRNSRKGSNFK